MTKTEYVFNKNVDEVTQVILDGEASESFKSGYESAMKFAKKMLVKAVEYEKLDCSLEEMIKLLNDED